MVKQLLGLQCSLSEDAADALAGYFLCFNIKNRTEKIWMIGYIEGDIKQIDLDRCLLLVHGVGYEVFIHAKTSSLTMGQARFAFFVHHHVREDGQLLFGFPTIRERIFFVC